MKEYKQVQLFDDSFINSIMRENINKSEMSSFERRFLGGLIAERQPKVILEVGVAEGGTSAFICYCMTELSLSGKVISVDLSRKVWRDKTKFTGYIAEAEYRKGNWSVDWRLLTGELVSERLDEIGNEIDMVIIDTVHSLPGEILDYLAVLPYIKNDGTVILHDVCLNHMAGTNAYATKILFDVVQAEKYYMTDETNGGLANIAAFVVCDETRNSVLDVFSCLSITWSYFPEKILLYKYRKIYARYYDSDCLALFDAVVDTQAVTAVRYRIENHYQGNMSILDSRWKEADNVYIYGCGTYGQLYYQYAKMRGYNVRAMLVSNDQIVKSESVARFKVPIMHLSELREFGDNDWIVMALKGDYYIECLKNLISIGYDHIL